MIYMNVMEGKNIQDCQVLRLVPNASRTYIDMFPRPLRWLLGPVGQIHDALFVEYRSRDGKSEVETTVGNHRRLGEPEYVEVIMGEKYFWLRSANENLY